jgi:trigger factor
MKTDIKEIGSSQKEATVEISVEEFEPFFQRVLKDSKENLSINGFRKGQVPDSLAQNHLDEGKMLEFAAEKAIKHFYWKYISDNKLEVIGPPEISITKLAKGNPLEFKAKFWILPEIKLPDYKVIASGIKREKVVVEDKEIEETIGWIQRSRSQTSPKEGAVQIGDFVEIRYSSASINNGQELVEDFVIGQSHLLPDFEKEIIGMKKDQEKEFKITFPQDYVNKEIAGKEVVFKVKAVKVESVQMQEINDEFAKSLGKFENLTQLKSEIRDGITKEKETAEKQKVQGQILDEIAKKTECDIPQILIDVEKEHAANDFEARVPEMLKMSFDDYLKQSKLTQKEFEESLIPSVKEKIKKSLILKELKDKENIMAGEEEITEEVNKFLSKFKSENEASDAIDPDHLRDYTRERIENNKALEFLENLAQK